MAKSDILISFIRSWEGGWSDNPSDSGGATMYGITLATFIRWRLDNNQPRPDKNDLRIITDDEWRDIFHFYYWNRLRANDINSQAVANMLVDWYWHSGITAVRTLQRLCRVTIDGIIGPKTIAAVNADNPEQLFRRLKEARITSLTGIAERRPDQRQFLKGWLRRVNSITYTDLIPNV